MSIWSILVKAPISLHYSRITRYRNKIKLFFFSPKMHNSTGTCRIKSNKLITRAVATHSFSVHLLNRESDRVCVRAREQNHSQGWEEKNIIFVKIFSLLDITPCCRCLTQHTQKSKENFLVEKREQWSCRMRDMNAVCETVFSPFSRIDGKDGGEHRVTLFVLARERTIHIFFV
jgi:hypothetical protein